MIADVKAQSEVLPRSRFDPRAKIEVECAVAREDRRLAQEILCRVQFGVARRTIAAETNAGGYKGAYGFVRGVKEVQRISGDLVEVNTIIPHGCRNGLGHLQPIGAEAVGSFHAPMFSQIDRAAQADFDAVLKLRIEQARTDHKTPRPAQ